MSDARETMPVLPKPPADKQVSPGDEVGRYVILSRVGEGGMGAVFAAYDPILDRRVAVKLLHSRPEEPSRVERQQRRLLREAQAIAKVHHPNVIAVHDVGEHGQRVFVAMEYISGQTMYQWLQAEVRSWREVVDVFIDAGRGLQAAHDAGLIHRDFKPDNVMIAKDGRVVVMDFGLACSSGTSERGRDTFINTVVRPIDDAFAHKITGRGRAVGTPAYMSLEQHLGLDTDPRSDQFSFCVALHEALYGSLPYDGQSAGEIIEAMTEHAIGPPPSWRDVPSWITEVLRRGLAPDPAHRFPTMAELLAELARDRYRRARRLGYISGGLGLVGLGVAVGTTTNATSVSEGGIVCSADRQEFAGVWDEPTRAAIREAFSRSGVGYASSAWSRFESHVDDYVERWGATYAQACTDTHVRAKYSVEVLDLRSRCLDERRRALAALTGSLQGELGSREVERASSAALKLPRVQACEDVAALRAETPPPEDPRALQEVRLLEDEGLRAKALEQLGRFEQALEIIDAVEDRAERVGYAPLHARALLSQGVLLDKVGQHQQAERTLQAAIEEVAAVRNLELHASAWIALFWHYIEHAPDLDRAEGLVTTVRAAVALADVEDQRATLLNDLGRLHYKRGRIDQALEAFDEALELRVAHLGPRASQVASILTNRALALRERGDVERARADLERALAIDIENLGPDHPITGYPLSNLGDLTRTNGDAKAAREYYSRALEVWSSAMGEMHPLVAHPLYGLGAVANEEEDHERAREYFERALAIRQASLEPNDPALASSIFSVGTVEQHLGNLEAAKGHFLRALEIWSRAFGEEHPRLAYAHEALGDVAMSEKDWRTAQVHYARAVALQRQRTGDPSALARAIVNLATVSEERGRRDEARASLREARGVLIAAGASRHQALLELIDARLSSHR